MIKSNKSLVGIITAISVICSNPLYASSNLGNLTILNGCSDDLIEEFEHAYNISGTDPYQRVRSGERVTTGLSPHSERKFSRCLSLNNQELRSGSHYQVLDFCSNVPNNSRVSNIISRKGEDFCLYEHIE